MEAQTVSPPQNESLTKNQVALEEVIIRKKSRTICYTCAVVSFVGLAFGFLGNFAFSMASFFAIFFIGVYSAVQDEQRLEYLNKKYGNSTWQIWTLTKLLKRNKD